MYQQKLQLELQNRLAEEQDEHIIQITEIARQMRKQGQAIGCTLLEQKQCIQSLNNEMDVTRNKLNRVQQKLGKLLDTNDAGQICTCVMMGGLTIVFTLFLFIV